MPRALYEIGNIALKILTIILLLLGLFAGFWNFKIYQKNNYLKDFVEKFSHSCKTIKGCLIVPDGEWVETVAEKSYTPGNWLKPSQKVYQKAHMTYFANSEEFTLCWHIATDTYLIASGGKNREVIIEKVSG